MDDLEPGERRGGPRARIFGGDEQGMIDKSRRLVLPLGERRQVEQDRQTDDANDRPSGAGTDNA